MKKISYTLMVLSFTLMISTFLWADVPAPPVNQIIGVNDGVFNDLVEADCRLCHENPDQFPVEDTTIPVRHHLLHDTVIPDPTDVPYGMPGELFECLSCHEVDTSSGIIQFIVERDCLACHTQGSSFELTVHHRTDLALGNLPQGPDCKACHGSLVDNMEDGHFIPTYDPSPVTPKRSGGTALPLNDRGKGAGACDYCHDYGTSGEGIIVETNMTTHHETGFYWGMGGHGWVCFWCHDDSLPFEEQIRVCENCHGRDSLHNIQVDSDGDGSINPGIELPGYGHIGEPDGCWGCHGLSASSEPVIGPIIPYIDNISKSVLTAASDTVVTLIGSAFKNTAQGTEYTSNITLSADDSTSIELIPDSISGNSMTVTIPGTLATGHYALRAVKLDKLSNPVNISIKPEVVITDVVCFKCLGTMTITGSGFSEKPAGTDEDISVMEGSRPLNVISWTDTEIQASGSRCRGEVTVNALFGSAMRSR